MFFSGYFSDFFVTALLVDVYGVSGICSGFEMPYGVLRTVRRDTRCPASRGMAGKEQRDAGWAPAAPDRIDSLPQLKSKKEL